MLLLSESKKSQFLMARIIFKHKHTEEIDYKKYKSVAFQLVSCSSFHDDTWTKNVVTIFKLC